MSLRDEFEKHVEATSVCWVEEMRNRLFARNTNGGYYEWSGLESRFKDFQAGHAAGLEDAAVECERMEPDTNHSGHVFRAHDNVYYAAAAIRAMKGEVK